MKIMTTVTTTIMMLLMILMMMTTTTIMMMIMIILLLIMIMVTMIMIANTDVSTYCFQYYHPFSRSVFAVMIIVTIITINMVRVWRIGRDDAFRPKGHGFDSRSSRHVGTLYKFLTHSCLWRFGVKLRHSIRDASGAPLSRPISGFEEAL